MNVDVLGPLLVRHGSVTVVPTAPKPRTVLAMLALHANQLVSVDALIHELWDSGAPRTATTTVQTYVLQLRRHIGESLKSAPGAAHATDPKRILATHPGGYMLNTPDDAVDMWVFKELASAGHRARERGDFTAAARNFADALALWRGPALVDVQSGPQLKAAVKGLDEARLNVLDRRIEAELRLGRHHELLGELTSLVAEYRTHEGLWAYLMHALYRSGRRSEALDAYRQLRANLVSERGLEPSPSLRRLHRSMLVSGSGPDGPDLAGRGWPGPVAAEPVARPAAIPVELALTPWDTDDTLQPAATGGYESRTVPRV
jgi:SARP family transcriptional regulator, regulator of embCAB operon